MMDKIQKRLWALAAHCNNRAKGVTLMDELALISQQDLTGEILTLVEEVNRKIQNFRAANCACVMSPEGDGDYDLCLYHATEKCALQKQRSDLRDQLVSILTENYGCDSDAVSLAMQVMDEGKIKLPPDRFREAYEKYRAEHQGLALPSANIILHPDRVKIR